MGCGVLCDSEMKDFSSPVTDHESGVQQLEANGGDDQEVHHGDAVSVVLKEGLPTLALVSIGSALWEIAGDSGEADRNAQLR